MCVKASGICRIPGLRIEWIAFRFHRKKLPQREHEAQRAGDRRHARKQLAESQQLEDFVNFRLYAQKNNVTALWLYQFKERGKRTDSG